jgi:hypothetical protein
MRRSSALPFCKNARRPSVCTFAIHPMLGQRDLPAFGFNILPRYRLSNSSG